jgi:tetratricopeptide (TPR) repeat protein
MAHVSERGKQLCIVHPVRVPGTGSVDQQVLCIIHSKEEARAAISTIERGDSGGFRRLLETCHPGIEFDWTTILREIEEKLHILPETYDSPSIREREPFYSSLCEFTKNLLLANRHEQPALVSVDPGRHQQLAFVKRLIDRWIEQRRQEPRGRDTDVQTRWRRAPAGGPAGGGPHPPVRADLDVCGRRPLLAPRGAGGPVPPEIEHMALSLYARGDLDRAESVFTLLTDALDDYSEGHRYLGVIAKERDDVQRAIECFRKSTEIAGRRLPGRPGHEIDARDGVVRPYLLGLTALASAYCGAGRFDETLAVCDRLTQECGADGIAIQHRARVWLNRGEWARARAAAERIHLERPLESLVAAYACFESGDHLEALTHFLFAALNHPFSCRIATDVRTARPATGSEELDQYHVVELYTVTRWFRERQSPASRDFFRRVLRDPRVLALLRQVRALERSIRSLGQDRDSTDRLDRLRAWSAARENAARAIDLIPGVRAGRMIVPATREPGAIVH